MDLFEKIITHIKESKFTEIEIEELEYDTFYDKVGGRLLIIYNEQIVQDNLFKADMNDIASSIRNSIKKQDRYNLWNTYLLILVNKNPFNERYYYIERDIRNLRKYVIQNEDDILRIPFIDSLENSINQKQENGYAYSVSKELRELYNVLGEKKICDKKLSISEIDKALGKSVFLGEQND